MKKRLQIKESVRFQNFTDLLIFLAISFFAYIVHILFQITIPSKAENFIAVLVLVLDVLINIYLVGQINTLLKRLEEQQTVWYTYLPDRYHRYPSLLRVNRWIWGSLLLILIFSYLNWLDSMGIVILYCLVDYIIRKRYIEKAINVSNEEERKLFLRAYRKISVRADDLGSLLIQGYRETDKKLDTVKLFGEMFMLYWNEKVKEELDGARDDFNLAYERIYNITYGSVEDIWEYTQKDIDFNAFLTDFLSVVEILTENDKTHNKYVLKTLLAAVIAFTVFEGEKLGQGQINQIPGNKDILKKKENVGIWLWCVEFRFQYNERKNSMEIALKPETLKLYNDDICFPYERDTDFYRFLWYTWTRRAKRSLSESIENLEELIEYCLEEKRMKSGTKSLYVLIKEIQHEQGMIL